MVLVYWAVVEGLFEGLFWLVLNAPAVNTIPILSQVKAAIQAANGDFDGARNTREAFAHRGNWSSFWGTRNNVGASPSESVRKEGKAEGPERRPENQNDGISQPLGRFYPNEDYSHLNELDENGWTKLHYAAKEGNVERIGQLVALGADPRVYSHIGSIPIHEATYNGQWKAMKALLESDASAKEHADTAKDDGWASIHLALLARCPVACIGVLLDAGADVNLLTKEGKTALDLTRDLNSSHRVVEYLVSNGGIRRV